MILMSILFFTISEYYAQFLPQLKQWASLCILFVNKSLHLWAFDEGMDSDL